MSWLAPLGWLYAALMRLRVWLFKKGFLTTHRLPGKVLSVGNLEVGGTGKSPVVIALAEFLLSQGAQPAILTRGYRSGLKPKDSAVYKGPQLILPPQSGTAFLADEARMQAHKLGDVPVIIGADRKAAAQRYLQQFPCPTHWILDDGFQHLKIHRDLNIVLLDAQNPFDNEKCLPAGRLREGIPALKRADLILLTRSLKSFESPELPRIKQLGKPIYKVFFNEGALKQVAGPQRSSSDVSTWGLALGIARPERVRESLSKIGLQPLRELIVLDHQSFPKIELEKLALGSEAMLTTEKDFWRSPEAFQALGLPVFVIPLTVAWDTSLSLPDLFRNLTN